MACWGSKYLAPYTYTASNIYEAIGSVVAHFTAAIPSNAFRTQSCSTAIIFTQAGCKLIQLYRQRLFTNQVLLMSFGYSIGDFISVATLAWKLGIVVRSAKGDSESFRDLICELDLTTQSLYTAAQLLKTAGLPASAANCIRHGLSRCHINLERLMKIVEEYKKCLETP